MTIMSLILCSIFLFMGILVGWYYWGIELKKNNSKQKTVRNELTTALKENKILKQEEDRSQRLLKLNKQELSQFKIADKNTQDLKNQLNQKESLLLTLNTDLKRLNGHYNDYTILKLRHEEKLSAFNTLESNKKKLELEVTRLRSFDAKFSSANKQLLDRESELNVLKNELQNLKPEVEHLKRKYLSCLHELSNANSRIKKLYDRATLSENMQLALDLKGNEIRKLKSELEAYELLQTRFGEMENSNKLKQERIGFLEQQLKFTESTSEELEMLSMKFAKQSELYGTVLSELNFYKTKHESIQQELSFYTQQADETEHLNFKLQQSNIEEQQRAAYYEGINKENARLETIATQYQVLKDQYAALVNHQAAKMTPLEAADFFPVFDDQSNLAHTQIQNSVTQESLLESQITPTSANQKGDKSRLKVLMLGWEFPPVINGGLGIACHGISKALSIHVDLKVVLPKVEEGFIVDNVDLLGLNQFDLKNMLREERENSFYSTILSELEYVNISMNPYDSDGGMGSNQNSEGYHWSDDYSRIDDLLAKFKDGEIYGENVVDKVILFAKCVVAMSKRLDFDIIYAHDWMTYLAGVELKKATGKPLAIHVHATQYDRAGADSRGWIYDIEKYGMQEADIIIPVSNYTATIVKDHYGAAHDKVFPVHNGVIAVNAFKKEKHFREKLVLFLGRVTDQKGPEFFLEVAAKVFEEFQDVRFVVAGTGDKLKRLIEAGAYKQIGDRFHFTGFLQKQQVHELLAMSDVYCMPSVSEPFGLSALEAAQFSIPMVISKQSGAAEVMSSALKADYWDVNLMANHITSLLTNPELSEELVVRGHEDLKKLTWEVSATKIVDALSKATISVHS